MMTEERLKMLVEDERILRGQQAALMSMWEAAKERAASASHNPVQELVAEVRELRARVEAAEARGEAKLWSAATEAMHFLEAAGMGAAGKPNTLWAMVVEVIAALTAERTRADEAEARERRLRAALATLMQRIDEGCSEQCPFCEVVLHEHGADHGEECPMHAAYAAVTKEKP